MSMYTLQFTYYSRYSHLAIYCYSSSNEPARLYYIFLSSLLPGDTGAGAGTGCGGDVGG